MLGLFHGDVAHEDVRLTGRSEADAQETDERSGPERQRIDERLALRFQRVEHGAHAAGVHDADQAVLGLDLHGDGQGGDGLAEHLLGGHIDVEPPAATVVGGPVLEAVGIVHRFDEHALVVALDGMEPLVGEEFEGAVGLGATVDQVANAEQAVLVRVEIDTVKQVFQHAVHAVQIAYREVPSLGVLFKVLYQRVRHSAALEGESARGA